MYKTGAIFFILSFSLCMFAAGEDFPIQVTCTEAQDLEPVLKIAVRPATNESRFFYKTPSMAEPVIINTGDAYGHSSSSSVTIDSSRGDRMSGNQGLKISAHSSRAGLRVLFYKNFEFELERVSDVRFMGKKLHYAVGKDAFPDTQIEGTVEFDNLTCAVGGL